MNRRNCILGIISSIPIFGTVPFWNAAPKLPIAKVYVLSKSIREHRWDLLARSFENLQEDADRTLIFPMSRMVDKSFSPVTGVTFRVKKYLLTDKKYTVFYAYDDGNVEYDFVDTVV